MSKITGRAQKDPKDTSSETKKHSRKASGKSFKISTSKIDRVKRGNKGADSMMKRGTLFQFSERKSRVRGRKRLFENLKEESEFFNKIGFSVSTASTQNDQSQDPKFEDSLLNDNEKREKKMKKIPRSKTQESCELFENIDSKNKIHNSQRSFEVKNGKEEFEDFMKETGYEKYLEEFYKFGIFSLDDTKSISEEDWKNFDIPLGHKIKIKKAVDNLKLENRLDNFAEQENIAKSLYITLEDASDDFEIDYNKKERSFDAQVQNKMEEEENSFGIDNVSTKIISNVEMATETAPTTYKNPARICYSCFKKIKKDLGSVFSGKRTFCSQDCLQSFHKTYSVYCGNEQCPRIVILKQNALYSSGKWYCKSWEECIKVSLSTNSESEEESEEELDDMIFIGQSSLELVSDEFEEDIDLDFSDI